MHLTDRRIFRLTARLCIAGVVVLTTTAQDLAPVPKEQADQISNLIGSQLTVKPARSRRVLVFWRCEGFVHTKGLEYGNQAIGLAASKTRAFSADFSNDYAALQPDNLARYDALVLNNTTGLKTRENRFIEPSLVDFVKAGKGLAVIHAGADNFNMAEQAAEMVGGRFWGHPWGAGGTWAFKLDAPNNPLNRAFGGKGFCASDEIYQQQSPFYNRAKLRVLISLDFADKATAEAQHQRRTDNDYAVSWIRPYGKGRVFYTSFAHDQRAFLDKALLTHILDGLQYAIGDLKADDTPAGLSEADLNRIKTTTDANVNETFAFLQDILAHTYHAKIEAENSIKLNALLKEDSTTVFGKKAILRALLSAKGAPDLNSVVACLKFPETRDWAATLIAGMPGKDADKALVQALAGAEVGLRCTLINALGIRKNTKAVVPYVADKNEAVATASLATLGRIGDPLALQTLVKPTSTMLEGVRQTALAACIGTMASEGNNRAATRAAKPLFDNAANPAPLRAAAAKALLLNDDDFFAIGIKDDCAMVRQAVIRAANTVEVKTLAETLHCAAPADQVALLSKLASRNARAKAAEVAILLGSDQEAVVCEALRALVKLGGADQVPAIFELTVREGEVGRIANEALADLRAPGVGDALITLAGKDPVRQVKVLVILGERAELAMVPRLKGFLGSEHADVRKETWKTFGKIADDTIFSQGVDWLSAVQDSEVNPAESAIRAAAKNVEPSTRAATLAAAWGKASCAAKKTLANLMAGYADPVFIAPLTGALTDNDRSLRETVLRALADWPSLEPYDALKNAVAAQNETGLKTVAIRGALKLALAHAGAKATSCCVELFKVAPDDKCRMTVAEALFNRDGLDSFTTLQGLFPDPACGGAAKRVYVEVYDRKVKQQVGVPSRELGPAQWKASASHAANDVKNAFDRKPETRWSSNHSSEKGMWFTLDLGENVYLSQVVLDTEKSGGDTPNGYEVFVSNDGKTWTGPAAKGEGNHNKKTVIPLAVQTSQLKIVTTGGRQGLHWSIHEIIVMAGLDQNKAEEIRKIADTLR